MRRVHPHFHTAPLTVTHLPGDIWCHFDILKKCIVELTYLWFSGSSCKIFFGTLKSCHQPVSSDTAIFTAGRDYI